MFKLGRILTEECHRVCTQKGTFFHILWDCPIIQNYWKKVVQIMSEVLEQEVHLDARWHILCVGRAELAQLSENLVTGGCNGR